MSTDAGGELPMLPPHFIMGAVSSIGVYYLTYHVTESILLPNFGSTSLKKNMQKFSTNEYISFLTIFPSTVHAAVHSFGLPSLIALGYSEGHNLHKIAFYDEVWPAWYQGFFAGYLVADFIKSYGHLGTVYNIHHVTACAAWTFSSYLRSAQWQTMLLQVCEFSTLFMNLRRLLLTSGYDSSGTTMSVVNLLFFLSFGAVRIVPLPMICREWVTDGFSTMRDKDGLLMASIGMGFTVIHVCLQTMWFGMMVKKLIKVIKGSHRDDENDEAVVTPEEKAKEKKED
jgi:hypothetical protein